MADKQDKTPPKAEVWGRSEPPAAIFGLTDPTPGRSPANSRRLTAPRPYKERTVTIDPITTQQPI